MEGKKILIRKSMIKFENNNRELSLVKYSDYLELYLNRQIITLLNSF